MMHLMTKDRDRANEWRVYLTRDGSFWWGLSLKHNSRIGEISHSLICTARGHVVLDGILDVVLPQIPYLKWINEWETDILFVRCGKGREISLFNRLLIWCDRKSFTWMKVSVSPDLIRKCYVVCMLSCGVSCTRVVCVWESWVCVVVSKCSLPFLEERFVRKDCRVGKNIVGRRKPLPPSSRWPFMNGKKEGTKHWLS